MPGSNVNSFNPNLTPTAGQAGVNTAEVNSTDSTSSTSLFSPQNKPNGTEEKTVEEHIKAVANGLIKSAKTADLMSLANSIKDLSQDVRDRLDGDINTINDEIEKRKEHNTIMNNAIAKLKSKPTDEAYAEIAKALTMKDLADEDAAKLKSLNLTDSAKTFGEAVEICKQVNGGKKLSKTEANDIVKSKAMQYVERDEAVKAAIYEARSSND